MKQSEQINELAKAIVSAQAEMRNVGFDKHNPHFKSQYTSLAMIEDECRPVLAKHGLAAITMPAVRFIDGKDYKVLCTRLIHASGQWLEDEMLLNPVKDDPQSQGSAITYARRYTLPGIGGFASSDIVDDDGEAASAEKARMGEVLEKTVIQSISTMTLQELRPYWDELNASFSLSEPQSLRIRSELGKRRKALEVAANVTPATH